MKNLQKNTLEKILEGEQSSISALANTVEVNRGSLSQLLNHNTQLSSNNWNKIAEAYPEYVEEAATNVVKKESKPAKKEEVRFTKPVPMKVDVKISHGGSDLESKKSNVQKATPSVSPVEQPALTKEQKDIKTKEENRHRNLNCPESHYHMKVPYRDLLRARPLCPLTQLPMMLKEEIKKYKELDEVAKKTFIASLNSSINLLG